MHNPDAYYEALQHSCKYYVTCTVKSLIRGHLGTMYKCPYIGGVRVLATGSHTSSCILGLAIFKMTAKKGSFQKKTGSHFHILV